MDTKTLSPPRRGSGGKKTMTGEKPNVLLVDDTGKERVSNLSTSRKAIFPGSET